MPFCMAQVLCSLCSSGIAKTARPAHLLLPSHLMRILAHLGKHGRLQATRAVYSFYDVMLSYQKVLHFEQVFRFFHELLVSDRML